MEREMNKKQQEELIEQHRKELWKRLGIAPDMKEENIFRRERAMDEKIDRIFEKMENTIDSATMSNKPSALIKKNFPKILDAYVSKEKQPELLYLLDKYIKFPYTAGYYRRCVRTERCWYLDSHVLKRIFENYYNLTFYGKTMEEYYRNAEYRMALDKLLGSYSCPSLRWYGDMIAAELDMGNTNLAQTIEDILMSENNTNVVSSEIIDGIVKSDNTHLHKLLGDFMLAARLQEGVRQAVCENMDRGTKEAFFTLLQVIVDNDLVRFSAVKRAVSVWTGICNEEHMDRITNKQLELMVKALKDKEYVQELLQSNDSIELFIGLWSQGFYEVEDSVVSCKKLVENGTKNQKLVVSYYNRILQRRNFTSKVANFVLETHPEDIELCAAFLPTYMPECDYHVRRALYGGEGYSYYQVDSEKDRYKYYPIPCTTYFDSEEQTRKHFELLKQLHGAVPKKGNTYSPCIFPWYSVTIAPSDVAANMALIAYMLQDNSMIDEVCSTGIFSELDTYKRKLYLRLLLHAPKTSLQRETLLQALGDKSPDARQEAFLMIRDMKLTEEDYRRIRLCIKYKAADIRNNVLALLEGQNDEALKSTIEELLADKKEEVRLGGLDLVVRLKKDEKRQNLYQSCTALLKNIENATEKEAVIIGELTGVSQADSVLAEEGYGLYNPNAELALPEYKGNPNYISKLFESNLFGAKKKKMYALLDKLEALYTANQNREYKCAYGEEKLLGEDFIMTTYNSGERPAIDSYPFPELWRGFYEEEIQDFTTLFNLSVFLFEGGSSGYALGRMKWFEKLAEKIYGKDFMGVDLKRYEHINFLVRIVENLCFTYQEEEENRKLLIEAAHSMLAAFMVQNKELSVRTVTEYGREKKYYAMDCDWFVRLSSMAKNWKTNEEFDEMFLVCQNVNKFYGCNAMNLTFLNYVKAYERKLISLDNVYQAALDHVGLAEMFQQMRQLTNYPNVRLTMEVQRYVKTDGKFEENEVFKTALDIYWNITEMILKVELKRSEVPTDFSYVINKISKIRGMEHLLDILTALGKDTLERSVYYSYYGTNTDKKTCLCHLLYVSEPLPGENGETLKQLLKGRKISDKRLVEVAMYNANWIDIVEEYLGWEGLKSGIYYFTAHMNERFSDRTAAIIAKYTPLTPEELNDGAFDLEWFTECSSRLGEERFKILYDSAKYISDSNKHTRGRKYADAVQGKVNAEELENTICDKRNKDLLMSYPLVTIGDENDVLHRYQFLQKFLKESRQFGAQRRASEAKAVSMGLQNLATNSGYTDVTRLTLNMETKLVENMEPYFVWQSVEDVQIKISVDEDGKPAVVCETNGKSLKNVPAKFKKNEFVVEIKEVCSQLKDQYVRTKAMMEQFMEDGVEFSVSEMENLQKNPIIAPILKNLVYISGEQSGFLSGSVLMDYSGSEQKLSREQKLRIAHPLDLWQSKNWQEYQKLLFERKVKQPFKQVFRELYVKTEEELEKFNSTRYAGNQIQPRKTVGCLKSRRWVADYEDGLQKIYYKENIVARIYALADWFSPSDVEAPTLEWVEFSDRKTFQPIKIEEVPDRIFSEVMRDVDLAVSVAHAGGVDPETSHSTMEMRRAIVEFNLPLFGLTNVTFAGNHAVIEGKRATYTVHLGSGVVFKRGGTQIAVLPVHSQHRGKLFLPFIDEDPKTAEIMSKIVLFAEDMKIKDPYILQQI